MPTAHTPDVPTSAPAIDSPVDYEAEHASRVESVPEAATSVTPPPTPTLLIHPERAEIQAGRPQPVTYSPTEGLATDTPVDYEAENVGRVESVPDVEAVPEPVASVTPPPRLPEYDASDLTPVELPPLPTSRTKTPYLDISSRGQTGSDRDEHSGTEDDSPRAVTPTQELDSSSSPELKAETTASSQLLHITTETLDTQLGVTAGAEQVDRDPAVVFKEPGSSEATLTLNPNRSVAFPAPRGSTAKSPIHVIMVNVLSQNQSGE